MNGSLCEFVYLVGWEDVIEGDYGPKPVGLHVVGPFKSSKEAIEWGNRSDLIYDVIVSEQP